MATLGSEDKPVLMTSKKNGGRISKGSRPKSGVYTKQYRDNWDKIFSKK